MNDLVFPHGRVIFQDCIEGIKEIECKSFNLVLTDPPYGIEYINKSRHKNGNDKNSWSKPLKNDKEIFTGWIEEVSKLNIPMMFCFCTHLNYPEWRAGIEKHYEYKNTIIWDKGTHTMGNLRQNLAPCYEMIIVAAKDRLPERKKRMKNLIRVSRGDFIPSSNEGMPVKPVRLLKLIVKQYGEKVLDPFLGSGSTGAACEELGIPWLGFEINEKLSEDIKKRVEEGIAKRREHLSTREKTVTDL